MFTFFLIPSQLVDTKSRRMHRIRLHIDRSVALSSNSCRSRSLVGSSLISGASLRPGRVWEGRGVKSSLTFILAIFSNESLSNKLVKSGWAKPKEILSSICSKQCGRRTDCKCAGCSVPPSSNMTKTGSGLGSG